MVTDAGTMKVPGRCVNSPRRGHHLVRGSDMAERRALPRLREELAWAAGYFDGDGCFHASLRTRPSGSSYTYTSAVIHSTDEELLQRFLAVVRIGKVTVVRGAKGNRKPVWQWRVQSFEQVQAVGAMLWPWLGTYRRTQLGNVAWTARMTPVHSRHKTHCPQGHRYDEANTYICPGGKHKGHRLCRACMREKTKRGLARARERYAERKRLERDQ